MLSLRSASILAVLLALACTALPALALESKVLTLEERNLSIDLNSSFEVAQKRVDNTTEGIFTQTLLLTNAQSKGAAFVQIGSAYDPTIRALSTESLSLQWTTGVVNASAPKNGTLAENWTATDRLGQNVTVFVVQPEDDSLEAFGKTMYVANWNVGQYDYVGLLSFFNRSVTSHIIETLSLSGGFLLSLFFLMLSPRAVYRN